MRIAIASLIGAAGVSLAVWQVWSSAAPVKVTSAARRDVPGGGGGGGGPRRAVATDGEGEPGDGPGAVVLNVPDPSQEGGMRRIEATSIEDVARQLGITADELRRRMAERQGGDGGGPDGPPERRVVRGPGGERDEIMPNPFKDAKGLQFEAPDAKTSVAARAALKRAIEAQLASVVDWGTAPVSTAEAIAEAAATAIVERLRGGAAWPDAVVALGGNRAAVPTDKNPDGTPNLGGAGSMLLTVFQGAGVDVSRVSVRKGASSTEGLAPSPARAGDGPAKRAIAVTRDAGPDGVGEMAVRMPTGDEFPDVQGFSTDTLPEVEIQVPVNLAQIEAPPGTARVSVIMAPVKADGPWQPAAFILRIDNGPAADAFMKTLRPRK